MDKPGSSQRSSDEETSGDAVHGGRASRSKSRSKSQKEVERIQETDEKRNEFRAGSGSEVSA